MNAVIIHQKNNTWKVYRGFRFNNPEQAEAFCKTLPMGHFVVTEQDLDGFFSSRFLAVPEHIKYAFYDYEEYGG